MAEQMNMTLTIKNSKGQIHKLIMQGEEGRIPSYIVDGDGDFLARRLAQYSNTITEFGLEDQETRTRLFGHLGFDFPKNDE